MARILVVDDDDDVRETVVQILISAGYEVSSAADGMQGLRLFRADGADLVISDILMPDKDGIETIKEMRAADANATIIAISGGGRYLHAALDDVLETAKLLGANYVLPKPFGPKTLLEVVEKAISGAPA